MKSTEDRVNIIYDKVKAEEVFKAEIGDKHSSWTFLFRQVGTQKHNSNVKKADSLIYYR